MVNVTERPPTDWNAVDWRRANEVVRNLRQRIFKASRQGDLKKVRSLQKLMLRSYSNTLVSVRRVTQVNAGKYTPGVDKLVVKTPERRAELVDYLMTFQPWRVKPNRRVYIPKASGKLRPLGIPSIRDRAIQARVKNALEPFWEARFEAVSYGFRPGRSCHDAIDRIWVTLNKKGKTWILDADIEGAFDNIDHGFLLRAVGNFPARELIRQWLKAGYVDRNVFHETESGTPQGGVVSPLLANIALHGMEEELGIVYDSQNRIRGPRVLVRYADDFVVLTRTHREAEKAYVQLYKFLERRGLRFNEEKTRIVQATDGFDFLGFNVRLYDLTPHRPRETKRWKLLIKPSDDSVKKFKEKLKVEWKKARGQRLADFIPRLNRITRGWVNYYRTQVAKKTFKHLDHWMHIREWQYALRSYGRELNSKKRMRKKYWGKYNPKRKDEWLFGFPNNYVWKIQWMEIQRHKMVNGTASPDDPDLKDYWESRIKAKAKGLPVRKRRIAEKQDHKCPRCGEDLDNDELLEVDHINGDHSDDRPSNLRIVHLYCHQQFTAEQQARRVRNKAT